MSHSSVHLLFYPLRFVICCLVSLVRHLTFVVSFGLISLIRLVRRSSIHPPPTPTPPTCLLVCPVYSVYSDSLRVRLSMLAICTSTIVYINGATIYPDSGNSNMRINRELTSAVQSFLSSQVMARSMCAMRASKQINFTTG